MQNRPIKFLLLCLSILLLALPALAEDAFVIAPQYETGGNFSQGLAPVTGPDGKYGFISEQGELVIPMRYDMAWDFTDGVSVVLLDEKYGMIDINGDIVVPIEYDDMDTAFEPGTPIYARQNDLYGFLDTQGTVIIPFQYAGVDMIGFSDGLCAVSPGTGHGYIDEAGNEVIPPIFRFAGMFSERVAPVHNGEKWGLALRDGEVPLGFIFDEIGWSMHEGVIAVLQGEKWALTDGTTLLTDFIYDAFGMRMQQGRIAALKDGAWGCLDASGSEALPFAYEAVGGFSEGLATVVLGDKAGFIDMEGNLVISCAYDATLEFQNGIAAVCQGEKWGVIDKSGEVIIPLTYDFIALAEQPLLAAGMNGKTGYIQSPAF